MQQLMPCRVYLLGQLETDNILHFMMNCQEK